MSGVKALLDEFTRPMAPAVAAADAPTDECQFCGGRSELLHRVPGERWAICDECLEEAGRRVRTRL